MVKGFTWAEACKAQEEAVECWWKEEAPKYKRAQELMAKIRQGLKLTPGEQEEFMMLLLP
ncbi:MAG: hypothetical protein HPY68_04675 [Candidatus Atribacteria bacterium]|nr:hypothetical protein [Candidatus Atribacteria bacterium]